MINQRNPSAGIEPAGSNPEVLWEKFQSPALATDF